MSLPFDYEIEVLIQQNNALTDGVVDIFGELIETDTLEGEWKGHESSESNTATTPIELVVASAECMGMLVAGVMADVVTKFDLKTTARVDKLRFEEVNKRPMVDSDGDELPVQSFELIMPRTPCSDVGINCAGTTHPVYRITPRMAFAIDIDRVCVNGRSACESECEHQTLRLSQFVSRFCVGTPRRSVIVRIETAFVPDGGAQGLTLAMTRDCTQGAYYGFFAHGQGVEPLGLFGDTSDIVDIGAFNLVNADPLTVWGECSMCGYKNSLDPQELPLEDLRTGCILHRETLGVRSKLCCSQRCSHNGHNAVLRLRRRGKRMVEAVLMIWVPIKIDNVVQLLNGVGKLPPARKIFGSIETHLVDRTRALDNIPAQAVHVDRSRSISVGAIVFCGVADPNGVHPSRGDICANVSQILDNFTSNVKSGSAPLYAGKLNKSFLRRRCDVSEKVDDQAERPSGKRRMPY